MPTRAVSAAVLALALAAPVLGADRDFDAVVRNIESSFGTHRMHIPLFGVVKVFLRIARPAGVKQLDLAIFEDMHGTGPGLDALDAAVRGAIGPEWQPMVRVRERREWTCIYAKPSGKDVRMLVATVDSEDTVLVHFKVNPERLARMLDEHPGRAHKCLGAKSSNACGG